MKKPHRMTNPDAGRAFHVSLLGGLEILTRTGTPVMLPARKAEALFAVLARRPGRRQDRERLTALLWPDSAPDAARTSLRQALKQLRRAFAADNGQIVLAEGDTLAVNGDLVEVDVARLEHASQTAERPDLAELTRVYRGDFLEGFASVEDPFDEWVAHQRMQLREQVADALSIQFIGDDHRLQSRHVVQLAVRLLAQDPLREDLHRLLMRLYLDHGRRAAALAQYRSCCTVLKQELDVAPEPETQALHREIREVAPRRPAVQSSPEPAARAGSGTEAVVARPALAVLPFVNLDGDEDRDYFADGLSEDVTIALAGWRRFPLIAGSSTLTYRKAPLDPHRLGEELGARYLVAGSIRHQGKQVRINVRLIDTGDGRILWTRRYDVAPGDILAAQDESATRIAAAIQPELEHAELRRIDTKRSADLNAWDHFLRRVSFLYRFSAEDHEFARSHFERAIEIDPDYGDGGMRHTTPLSPPILMGADKLLVIETRSEGQDPEPELCVRYPSLGDIGSYLLDVIFMDHLHNDLTRLRQINHILEHLPESQAEQTGFRSIETLLIQPSRDLREIATRHMHRIPASVKALMRGVGAWGPGRLPSYLLFEVEFCRELIALGYRDGQAARERVQVFMTP